MSRSVAHESRALASVPGANVERLAAMPLDRARLSVTLPRRGPSPSRGWPSLTPIDRDALPHEYRVFMVNHWEEGAFLHLTPEKLRDGTIIEVDSPGTELRRRPVTVYSVLTHAVDGRPGIAYERGSAFDAEAGGRTELPTKGVPVSMQETGEEREPQPPPGTTPEPGEMPEEPGTAPEAPSMPEDPDRDPSQPPPDESGNP